MSNRKKIRQAPSSAPTTRQIVPIVIAFALGALLAGPVGAVTAGADDPTDDRVAALRAEENKRDAAQVVELTARARQVQESLLPVLDGLATAVPVAKAPGPAASRPEVERWQAATGKAVEDFANPPSGGTGVNIARSGLAAAVQTLDAAVDTYAAALDQPPAGRASLFELTGRQRDAAVAIWGSAATQLDVLNVDAGNGHAHVFLPAVPGQGALTADGAPEGK
ncbi:hypothetical protein [Micromonospora sp. KC721]|uniref:hypothetical protein n=1 Tax=Micromonospora sp. KC721 TaxID=2530380 RepID=UPI0010DAB4D9|nr:hypothetical protein [Micromonospora sp. KC721]TDB82533.1 hypothetical protein E1182_01080 [Micromonospora sp. KC721]